MRMIEKLARAVAETIDDQVPDILAEGAYRGQQAQDPQAEQDYVIEQYTALALQVMKSLVQSCAAICERRASVEERHQSIRSEATKCAAQIRHEMLCSDGESVCLTCEGTGVVSGLAGGVCYQCNGKGVRVYVLCDNLPFPGNQ